MKSLRTMLVVSLAGLIAVAAWAQPAGGRGPGAASGPMGAGPMASAPGMGMGKGPGAGRGAARSGSGVTPGWALMTEQERTEHRGRMQNMKTQDECKTYQAQHHEQMVARAKERGSKALPAPRRDPCAGLP